ncbi:MAG: SPOR domain-containing protein [Treponema sp.]|nr:SPOR domain-containing protein [Treponema sp.]
MEKGKYYVQLGAFRSIASVESALLTINPGYPVNVQNSGSAEEPMYRLLVGPVNLGESGALVQRFKGSGYRDAYIRTGG